MRYRKIYLFLVLMAFWIVEVWNWGYLRGIGSISDSRKFININSSDMGYHSFILVGTIYSLLFLYFNALSLNIIREPYMIRMGRKTYIGREFVKTYKNAIVFSFLFTFTNVIGNLIFVDHRLLVEYNIIVGSILYFISMIFYYCIIGSIYLIAWSYTKKSQTALWISGIIVTALIGLYIIFHYPTLIMDVNIISDFYEGNFVMIQYIVRLIKNIIVVVLLHFMAKMVFERTDIIFYYEE